MFAFRPFIPFAVAREQSTISEGTIGESKSPVVKEGPITEFTPESSLESFDTTLPYVSDTDEQDTVPERNASVQSLSNDNIAPNIVSNYAESSNRNYDTGSRNPMRCEHQEDTFQHDMTSRLAEQRNQGPHSMDGQNVLPQGNASIQDQTSTTLHKQRVHCSAENARIKVSIVGGKYKGKTGSFVKNTPKCIQVIIDGADKAVYLKQEHVLIPTNQDYQAPVNQQKEEPAMSTTAGGQTNALPAEAFRSCSKNTNVVEIIEGRHKGKSGTFVKRTEKRISVMIDGARQPVYLIPEHVMIPTSRDEDDWTIIPSPNSQIICRRPEDIGSTVQLSPTQQTASDHIETLRSYGSDVTSKVEIVGGKYLGKFGTFVKRTPKLIQVVIDGMNSPVCLRPDNVLVRNDGNKQINPCIASNSCCNRFMNFPDDANSIETQDNSSDTSKIPSTDMVHGIIGDYHGHSSTTSCSYFNSVLGDDIKSMNTKLGLRVEFCKLLTASQESQREQTMAFYWFQNRLATYKVDLAIASSQLPFEYIERDGCKYELLATKVLDKIASPGKARHNECKSEYVLVFDPSTNFNFNLQKMLEDVADFGALTPQKAAARLQLLLSTACKSDVRNNEKKNCIFDGLSSSDFEMIEENSNEGCGFIPREYIHKFFGEVASQSRIFALQVRIFAPRIGILKGMLVEKPGIDKIQLPQSMLKVPKSRNNHVPDWAVILITSGGIVPSKTCRAIENIYKGYGSGKDIDPKFREMMWNVLNDHGVPQSVIDAYISRWSQGCVKTLRHASVTGVADPTNAIPSDQVFITGISTISSIGSEIFVSRYPCTNRMDGRKLRVCQDRPPFMSIDKYKWLIGLPFGSIIFGNALPGHKPMPTMIADGDLDGDKYFICWEENILRYIDFNTNEDVDTEDCSNHTIQKTSSINQSGYNKDWFRDAKSILSDVETLSLQGSLIGQLHRLWQNVLENKKVYSRDTIVATGNAFKQAIDIQKHGGKVNLPSILWNQVQAKFRHMLVDLDQTGNNQNQAVKRDYSKN